MSLNLFIWYEIVPAFQVEASGISLSFYYFSLRTLLTIWPKLLLTIWLCWNMPRSIIVRHIVGDLAISPQQRSQFDIASTNIGSSYKCRPICVIQPLSWRHMTEPKYLMEVFKHHYCGISRVQSFFFYLCVPFFVFASGETSAYALCDLPILKIGVCKKPVWLPS